MKKGFVYTREDDEVTVVPSPEIAELVVQLINNSNFVTVAEDEEIENSRHNTTISSFPEEENVKVKIPCLFSVVGNCRIQNYIVTDEDTAKWLQSCFLRLIEGSDYGFAITNLENDFLPPNKLISATWEW